MLCSLSFLGLVIGVGRRVVGGVCGVRIVARSTCLMRSGCFSWMLR
nr:MAG TPA: hypothetical protein [Caudoviricetes sp.]